MIYQRSWDLMRDPEFQGRVRMALIEQAKTEWFASNATPNSVELTFCTTILKDPEKVLANLLRMMVTEPAFSDNEKWGELKVPDSAIKHVTQKLWPILLQIG